MTAFDNEITITSAEPPVIAALRKNFSSVPIFLSAILGILSVALFPAFFRVNINTQNLGKSISRLFINGYGVFLPELLFYISLLITAALSVNDFKPLRSARFFAVRLFLSLTAVGFEYMLYSVLTLKIGSGKISVTEHIKSLDNYGIAVVASTAVTFFAIVIYNVCIGRISRAVKFNQPYSGCTLITAIIFMLSQFFKSYVIIDEVMIKNNISAERFKYGAVTGASLCLVLCAAAALLFAITLFKYSADIVAIKIRFMNRSKAAV